MNAKSILKSILEGLDLFFLNCWSVLVSLARFLIFGSIRTAVQSKKYISLKTSDVCYVLGNGPSLNDVLNSGLLKHDDGDFFCVNMFCKSSFFRVIKPRFYILCDGAYFNPTTERLNMLVKELIEAFNLVDWEMFVIIPPNISPNSKLLSQVNNSNVCFIKNNSNAIMGFRFFRHFFYKNRLGMPLCQTVINYTLMTAINMRYKKIMLFGADHSWTKDTWVGDDNKVYTGDPHLYKNATDRVLIPTDFSTELLNISRVFSTHKIIREFADYMNVIIINKTKGSFIDAYERK